MTIELSKSEALLKVNEAFTCGNENFYNIYIELSNGKFMITTPENINQGVKFWLIN